METVSTSAALPGTNAAPAGYGSELIRVLRIAAGVASLGVIVVIALRVSTAAAAHSSFLVPSGRQHSGYPAWMRGPFAGLGGALTLRSFLLLMMGMAAAWLVTLACASALPRWVVPAAVLVATLIFTLAPPLLSSDVFNYIAYGRLGIHGISPYAHGPAALMGDPVYPYTGHLWKHDPSAYGPVFTVLSYALAPLGTAGALWALKVIMGLAALGCAALVWLGARHVGRSPATAVAFFALNPLVLVYAVGGAHNDLLMALFVALSLWLALRGRAAASGVAIVIAVAVKVSAGLVVPFLLLGARPRRRTAVGMAAAAVVVGGAAFAIFGPALRNMFSALGQQQHFNWIVISIPAFVGHYLGLGKLTPESRHLLIGAFAASLAALLVRTRAGRGWLEAAAAATLVLLVTTGWLLPWYIVWVLPLAALLRGRVVPGAAIVLTLLLLAMQLDHFWLTRGSHRHHHVTAHALHVHRLAAGPATRRAR